MLCLSVHPCTDTGRLSPSGDCEWRCCERSFTGCSVWVRFHGVRVYEGAYFLVKRSQCPERKSKKLSRSWSKGSQMCFPSGVSLGADSLTHFSADRPTPHLGGLPLLPQHTAHADWFPELNIITDSPPVWTSLPHPLPPRNLPPHALQLGAHKERSPGTAHPAFTDAQLGSQQSPGRAAWMLSTHGAFQSSPAPRGHLETLQVVVMGERTCDQRVDARDAAEHAPITGQLPHRPLCSNHQQGSG